MSNIKQWSRQHAPNEVWAAAAASAGIDMDTDSGSGSGGGAMEARFKALEDDNVKLRQEMGGVVSSVKDLVMTVKEMGTNMNMGFAQLTQANQQGSAALLARIQGTDASVAMLGHAVAGMPESSFVMPGPTAAAVTGYGGSGGVIASAAGADAAMNGAPNEVAAAVSETALVAVAPMADPRLTGAPFQAVTTAAPGGSAGYIGAPMCPEHCDGLDDSELPTRTAAPGETWFERMRRILIYSTNAAPAATDETGGTLGSLATAEGRRSARLTSATGTGDDYGTVGEDGTSHSRIAFSIIEERRVLDRLRAVLPPPVTIDSNDSPETGGSVLMGEGCEAYYNEPLVRIASTTVTVNDGDGAIGGTTQGTVEGPLTLTAAAEAMGGATGIPDMP
jgi:hypothetical protein